MIEFFYFITEKKPAVVGTLSFTSQAATELFFHSNFLSIPEPLRSFVLSHQLEFSLFNSVYSARSTFWDLVRCAIHDVTSKTLPRLPQSCLCLNSFPNSQTNTPNTTGLTDTYLPFPYVFKFRNSRSEIWRPLLIILVFISHSWYIFFVLDFLYFYRRSERLDERHVTRHK